MYTRQENKGETIRTADMNGKNNKTTWKGNTEGTTTALNQHFPLYNSAATPKTFHMLITYHLNCAFCTDGSSPTNNCPATNRLERGAISRWCIRNRLTNSGRITDQIPKRSSMSPGYEHFLGHSTTPRNMTHILCSSFPTSWRILERPKPWNSFGTNLFCGGQSSVGRRRRLVNFLREPLCQVVDNK